MYLVEEEERKIDEILPKNKDGVDVSSFQGELIFKNTAKDGKNNQKIVF
jgi:hypothetical protein